MRFVILLSLVASASFGQGRFDRFNSRTDQGRSHRGFEQSSGALYEFAPVSGAGMGTACACTTPTGSKSETLTFSRTSNGTCNPVGNAGAGLANNALVTCGSGGARVEPSGGVLGLRVEAAADNVLLRFIELNNPPWADVGTPTPTTAQTSPWVGTFASSAVLYDDNDGAAFEGRTQTISVTAATQYTMSCWVKAGTLSSWTLSLDGTTASGTGLSSTTWSLVQVTDASSSGVAVSAQVLNGSTAAATGTLTWGGCQVELGAYPTSMIPTTAAVATRAAEAATLTLPVDRTDTTICLAATIDPDWSTSAAVPAFGTAVGWAAPMISLLSFPAGAARFFTSNGTTGAFVSGRQRLIGRDNNTTVSLSINGTLTSAAVGASVDRWTTAMGIGSGGAGAVLNSIVSLVQADPDPTRCL